MNVSEVLNQAADVLEPEGAWTQGALWRTPDGTYEEDGAVCFCIQGALYLVTERIAGGVGEGDAVREEAEDFLETLLGRTIPGWNDDPERTQAEVVAKLREAAEQAATQ